MTARFCAQCGLRLYPTHGPGSSRRLMRPGRFHPKCEERMTRFDAETGARLEALPPLPSSWGAEPAPLPARATALRNEW